MRVTWSVSEPRDDVLRSPSRVIIQLGTISSDPINFHKAPRLQFYAAAFEWLDFIACDFALSRALCDAALTPDYAERQSFFMHKNQENLLSASSRLYSTMIYTKSHDTGREARIDLDLVGNECRQKRDSISIMDLQPEGKLIESRKIFRSLLWLSVSLSLSAPGRRQR